MRAVLLGAGVLAQYTFFSGRLRLPLPFLALLDRTPATSGLLGSWARGAGAAAGIEHDSPEDASGGGAAGGATRGGRKKLR